MQRLRRWLAGPAPAAWSLHDYASFEPPHPGWGRALSLPEAERNLAHFQAGLAERQRRLRDWLLTHQGPDAQALPAAAYARALKAWARAHWHQLPPADRLPPHPPWPDCPRSGPFVVHALLGDLAASLGEAIRRANPDWRWGLNLDAADLADGMASARRVVLLADLADPSPEAQQAVLDLEPLLFNAHRFPQSVDFVHLDTWTLTVVDAVGGAYHRP